MSQKLYSFFFKPFEKNCQIALQKGGVNPKCLLKERKEGEKRWGP